MLKVRVIPTLLYKNYGLVKGVGFDSWRRVGTALPAIRVYETRQVDELVFVDISATDEERSIDIAEIDRVADDCSMPFTAGGGVRSIEDIRRVLRAGADKVVLNTIAVEQPSVVSNGASSFGAQCIVVSIDVRRHADGRCEVFTHSGKQATGLDPVAHARAMEARGAGEILVTSIERDGTMQGYDIPLIRSIADAVTIPVIASGGAGNYEHMLEAVVQGHASAVAAASMFHFTECTPLEAKRYLHAHGVPTRL